MPLPERFMKWLAPRLCRAKLGWQSQQSNRRNEERADANRGIGNRPGQEQLQCRGTGVAGRVVLRRRLRRDGVIKLAAGMPCCVMAMEACCGAHHLGRLLRDHGHQVRLMSPEYVRPYVKAQKNDDRDAEAIAEAATRPTMRFVELKSEAQLDVQSLHRARDRLVASARL